MVNISFFLDRPDHKYSPGDVLSMEIRVQATSETKYRSIYARIQGFAHVEWTESRQVQRDGKSHTEYTTYSSDESYFKNYKTLAGGQSGEMRLAAGSYVYHASFTLPKNLPENHENEYGHIRYEAKVHIDVPWGFDEKEKTAFYVNPRFNLNEFPHLREPVRALAEKTFGCCCWSSEPLRIFNILPRSGYVPGDRVQYSLELNNDSDVAIDGATVKLVERIVYHAHSPSSRYRDNSRTLWMHEFMGNNQQLVAAMQNKVFSTDLYFDPSWGFSFFDGCGIITVEYQLKATARASGCHTNLSNETTINMGTIPLATYTTISPSVAPMMPFPSAPSGFPAPPEKFPSAPPAPISEQPLPSYNDAQSKPMAFAPPAGGIGWAATAGPNNSEAPPPTFTEVELMGKKEQKEKEANDSKENQ